MGVADSAMLVLVVLLSWPILIVVIAIFILVMSIERVLRATGSVWLMYVVHMMYSVEVF